MTLYLLLTSVNPLKLYLYKEGVVSFCTEDYTLEIDQLTNKQVHLSNYSINKSSEKFNVQSHRWKLSDLWKYLKNNGVDVDEVWKKIEELCIKSVALCLEKIREMSEDKLASHYTSFKLMSVDIMLDEEVKPWLLEVELKFVG